MKPILFYVLILSALVSACTPSQCDYEEGELILFSNPDSSGISFMAHESFKEHLFQNQAFEKANGDVIAYGTKPGVGVHEFAADLYQMATAFPGTYFEKIEEGEQDGFDYYLYCAEVAYKEEQEQLYLYIGNDTLVSSISVRYSKTDGGCHDAALEILYSVTLDLEGYKAPFDPYANKK